MIASIPWLQSALYFSYIEFWFVSVVSKCWNYSIFSKDLLSVLILWLRPAFWSRDMPMNLVLSAFTSSPISLLATTKASCVFLYNMHAPIQKILWIITSNTRVGTLIVATIYLQLIQNRYMFRSFTLLQCSHQHCVQPVANDVEVVGYL